MIPISKISRITHPGVLTDFSWPTDLPTFARFNLVYGWNGSGKTILSRFFRHLEHRTVPHPGEVTMLVNGRALDGRQFDQAHVAVRVFNRDFVNESVFPVNGNDVPPIFVVGRENVEKQKQVDRLREIKSGMNEELQASVANEHIAIAALESHCMQRAKAIKDTLRVSGPGAYNDYHKGMYKRDAETLASANLRAYSLDDTARDRLLQRHRQTIKNRVGKVEYRFPDLNALHAQVAELAAQSVTSRLLDNIKDDHAVAEWLHHGLNLHQHRDMTICLFCEGDLSSARLEALQAHFSRAYDAFIERIEQRSRQLKHTRKLAEELHPPDQAVFYEDIAEEYCAAHEILEAVRTELIKFLDRLVTVLSKKRQAPFDRLAAGVDLPDLDLTAVERLNCVIQKHNQACEEFEARTSDARRRLAHAMIAESMNEYLKLADDLKTLGRSIADRRVKLSEIDKQISRLEQGIVEHRQPAEELNEDLRQYLGHNELALEVRETGYALTRHGVPADSLSDGERTALALLYFLKSLRDRRFDISKGVVVLDDPVSSLDANALYLAFGYIRECTQDAGQLFLLTHNFTFFRQARNWFHHLKGQNSKKTDKRPARFYMLARLHEPGVRRTALQQLDPLLELYESEYHYLFACVFREASVTGARKLEQTYFLPNVARRLLEMFLAFRLPQFAGQLWQKMKQIDFDDARKTRIIRFVHIHSHGDAIADPEHDTSALGEAPSVLSDLLELMESEDLKHYRAMVQVVSPPAENQVGP